MAYKAFVSSTFKDLEKHRAYVIDALRKAGFFVDPMEDWVASNDEPKVFSKARIEGCDLCILLVGFRRGFIPDGENKSITQLEYHTARMNGLDILVFVLDENSPWRREYDEIEKDPEMKKWRQYLQKEHGIGFFDLEPSSIPIAPALTRWLAERINQGTIQYDYKYILSLQPELVDLEQKCQITDTGEVLKVLREKIIIRLKELASKNSYKTDGKPPAEILRTLAESKLINAETQRSLEYAIGVTSEILYGKKVKSEEAMKAIQETAVGFNLINTIFIDLPQFRIVIKPYEMWTFMFLIDNKVLIEGEDYRARLNLLNGIRSARNVVVRNRIFECETKNGKHYFILVAGNNERVGHSILFENNKDMSKVIKSVKDHLPLAPIIDVTN